MEREQLSPRSMNLGALSRPMTTSGQAFAAGTSNQCLDVPVPAETASSLMYECERLASDLIERTYSVADSVCGATPENSVAQVPPDGPDLCSRLKTLRYALTLVSDHVARTQRAL